MEIVLEFTREPPNLQMAKEQNLFPLGHLIEPIEMVEHRHTSHIRLLH